MSGLGSSGVIYYLIPVCLIGGLLLLIGGRLLLIGGLLGGLLLLGGLGGLTGLLGGLTGLLGGLTGLLGGLGLVGLPKPGLGGLGPPGLGNFGLPCLGGLGGLGPLGGLGGLPGLPICFLGPGPFTPGGLDGNLLILLFLGGLLIFLPFSCVAPRRRFAFLFSATILPPLCDISVCGPGLRFRRILIRSRR